MLTIEGIVRYDEMMTNAAQLAASQFGQDVSRVRDWLISGMTLAKIPYHQIRSIEYKGPMESLQHRFSITTKGVAISTCLTWAVLLLGYMCI